MADDVAQALQQMGIDSADVWGFSDGAIQGLLLAVHHPGLVKKLLAGVPNIVADSQQCTRNSVDKGIPKHK